MQGLNYPSLIGDLFFRILIKQFLRLFMKIIDWSKKSDEMLADVLSEGSLSNESRLLENFLWSSVEGEDRHCNDGLGKRVKFRLVNINLDEGPFAIEIYLHLLQNGVQCPARTAPIGRELHHIWCFQACHQAIVLSHSGDCLYLVGLNSEGLGGGEQEADQGQHQHLHHLLNQYRLRYVGRPFNLKLLRRTLPEIHRLISNTTTEKEFVRLQDVHR